jgi:large subunit ribosomal protein L6
VLRADDTRENRSKHGLMRAHLANMVKGVTDGWTRELEINGVGYRAEVANETLTMALGYSHPVVFKLPKGVGAKVDKNRITLSGADRDLLGQTAAKVRELRPPEPYKGKGVKYVEETIKKKVGKAGATGSGGS